MDTAKVVLVDNGSPVAASGGGDTKFIYNLLPVGRFYDKRYGEMYIGDSMLRKMEENFGKYPAYKVPVKIGHGDGAPSPGEVIGIQATPEGLEITMTVDKETSAEILKKRYKFMSAEFDENYIDKETGEPVGAVLLGAALVNQPANPYMEPLVLADAIDHPKQNEPTQKETEDMDKDAIELLKTQLDESKAREAQARKELSDALEAQKTKEAEAQAKAAEAEVQAAKAEAEAKAKAQAEIQAQMEETQSKADEAQKRIAELEAANKSLLEEKERAEVAKNEAEVKSFCDKWAGRGIPPAMLEKVKPLLLNKGTRVIKLSDDGRNDVPSLKFFDDLFDGLPKVQMRQVGSGTDNPDHELSDVEAATKRAEAIAASIGCGAKQGE